MSNVKKNQNKEELSFEEAMAKLENVSAALAQEGISLDDAMRLYSEGVELVRICNGKLEVAERTIRLLGMTEDGEVIETDFSAE